MIGKVIEQHSFLIDNDFFHRTTTTTTSASTPLEADMPTENDISLPPMETICLSSGDDDNDNTNNNSHNEDQHSQQEQMQTTDILSPDSLLSPIKFTSTPLLAHGVATTTAATTTTTTVTTAAAATTTTTATTAVTTVTRRQLREMENELFHNIETLAREFVTRTNTEYPHYRVIRWTVGEQPTREYVLTVVLNRPAIILE